MTSTEMGSWFDLLQDKFNSPYFTSTEKSLFLTRAQENFVYEIVSNILNKDVEIESKEQDVEKIQTLVYEFDVTTNASGVATVATMNTNLTTEVGSSAEVLKVLSVEDESGNDIMFMRFNDDGRLNRNVFKAPSTTHVKRKITAEGVHTYPEQVRIVTISSVKKPNDIDIDTPGNSEMPEFTHNKIVAKALQLAGVTTEDEALLLIDNIS